MLADILVLYGALHVERPEDPLQRVGRELIQNIAIRGLDCLKVAGCYKSDDIIKFGLCNLAIRWLSGRRCGRLLEFAAGHRVWKHLAPFSMAAAVIHFEIDR